MDNLTHTLFALTLARTRLGRVGRLEASTRALGPRLPAPCAGATPGRALATWPPPIAPQPDGAPRCLIDVAAIPTFGSPFHWQLIAQTSTGYDLHTISVVDPRLRQPDAPVSIWRLARHTPNRWTPAVQQAASTRTARIFLGFSRFPAVRASLVNDTTVVQWTDPRFGPESSSRRDPRARSGLFTATVRLDRADRVIAEGLGP